MYRFYWESFLLILINFPIQFLKNFSNLIFYLFNSFENMKFINNYNLWEYKFTKYFVNILIIKNNHFLFI